MLNLEEGTLLVKAARNAVKKFLERQSLEPEKTKNKNLNARHSIFVTIKNFPDLSLRGCIGFISPVPLYEGTQRIAVAAAFEDPRFNPLEKGELENLVFEVSVMTEPTLVLGKNLKSFEDLKKKIKIGCDGLMISNGFQRGLLLPQVPIEQKWGVDEFLCNLCYKAGMSTDALRDENTKIWKFQCQIFAESEPNGRIEMVKLK